VKIWQQLCCSAIKNDAAVGKKAKEGGDPSGFNQVDEKSSKKLWHRAAGPLARPQERDGHSPRQSYFSASTRFRFDVPGEFA
jgi:hypothetical protein